MHIINALLTLNQSSPPLIIHHEVILRGIALKALLPIADEGICRGISIKWIESILTHDETAFTQRMHRILHDDQLLEKINQAKEKVRQHQQISSDEQELFNTLAFFDNIMLYLLPDMYTDLFGISRTQQDIVSISEFAASENTEIHGGLRAIYDESGIYTQEEIKNYLTELAQAIDEANCPTDTEIGFILSSHDHAIALSYNPSSRLWRMMDINQYKEPMMESSAHISGQLDTISSALMFGFDGHDFGYSAFNTTAIISNNINYTIDSDDYQRRLTENLAQLKQHHVITEEIAKRSEAVNLLWIAANYGNLGILEQLLERGSAINQANSDGATPLLIAAYKGHLDIVERLLERGADIHQANNDGATPLIIAAQQDYIDIVERLLASGANIHQANNDGATPLFIAAQQNHIDIVERLLTRGANIHQAKNNGATPLFMAAQKGHLNIVRRLCERRDLAINQANNGETSLFIAAYQGHTDIIKQLCQREDLAINQANNDGATPLFMAAQKGHLDIVERLLARGANINQARNDGVTPLLMAVYKEHLDIVERLLARGANINQANNDGETPLLIAAQNGHLGIVEQLLARSANINQARNDDVTPLLIAAYKGHLDIVERLLARGADTHQANNDGETPLFIAAQKGHLNIVERLLARGANINQARNDGAAPLLMAIHNGHLGIVEQLLKRGADVNQASKIGITPLWMTALMGHLKMIKLILQHPKHSSHTLPFVSTADYLRSLAQKKSPAAEQKMHEFIENKSKIERFDELKISLLPKDIAFIMGHDEVVKAITTTLTFQYRTLFIEAQQTDSTTTTTPCEMVNY